VGKPRVIPDALRQRIAADARRTVGTLEGSARKLAQRHGVSESTVRRIVQEDTEIQGFGSPQTRARTEKATEALKLSLAQRREKLAEAFLTEAERAIRDANADEYQVFNFGGKDNTFEMRSIHFVPVKDRQILLTTAAIAADKHKMLDQYDADARDADAVSAWIAGLSGRSAEVRADEV